LVAVGFEIALTRYFAVASWSEYGYWVISMALAGFAASGVVLSLFKDAFSRRKDTLFLWMPTAMLLAAAVGFHLATINPFNPLELQNQALWRGQLWNIAKYYLALFPFFFLAGAYIGLYFVSYQRQIPRAYGADLAGAGAGGLVTLALTFFVHPFHLVAALMPCLVPAGYLYGRNTEAARSSRALAGLLLALLAGEAVVIGMNRAAFNEYKAIYAPLHVPGAKVLEERRSPRGVFDVLDDFTERLDADFSNNAASLGIPEPPTTLGLYGDGTRLTSLPRDPHPDTRYVEGALDAVPYLIRPGGRTLLIGTRGSFRIAEAASLGAGPLVALEPDPALGAFAQRYSVAVHHPVEWVRDSPAVVARTRPGTFDIVDIASDFLTQTDANRYVFTVDGIAALYGALSHNGILSIPVSIRELTVYAVKMLRTVQTALTGLEVVSPGSHIAVYRSAWNARILVFKGPIAVADLEALRAFCDRRSFDLSYYPGIRPDRVRIWNDLPLVSFEDETIVSAPGAVNDALMAEAVRLFDRGGEPGDGFFNTTPSTYDRPFFFSVVRLDRMRTVLRKIALLPREEIAFLVNVAVLLQAALLAVIVLALPLIRWHARLPRAGFIITSILYFAALGLGFLFLEILLIEKVALLLNDRTSAFALVLTVMLFFSGVGSWYSGRFSHRPRAGVLLAAAAACAWIALALLALDRLLLQALAWPGGIKIGLVIALVAPLAIALGFPFPLGLSAFRGDYARFLPWAWSLNGAFSVISTPLANLVAVSAGYRMVLAASLILYASILLTFPGERV